MSEIKCANCGRYFEDEVVKGWGSNLCEECADKIFNNLEDEK